MHHRYGHIQQCYNSIGAGSHMRRRHRVDNLNRIEDAIDEMRLQRQLPKGCAFMEIQDWEVCEKIQFTRHMESITCRERQSRLVQRNLVQICYSKILINSQLGWLFKIASQQGIVWRFKCRNFFGLCHLWTPIGIKKSFVFHVSVLISNLVISRSRSPPPHVCLILGFNHSDHPGHVKTANRVFSHKVCFPSHSLSCMERKK